MARKKKEFNKSGPFQTRLRKLVAERRMTQDKLAKALGVSRPTVAGWLNGDNIPDILDFEKIARYFGVSADYLLGLSNTATPDVSARAAVEYTGLTQAAVEWLHAGLDDYSWDTEGNFKQEREANLATASALIDSFDFSNIIRHLREATKEAYFEKILTILQERYPGISSSKDGSTFHYATETDRKIIKCNLCFILRNKLSPWKDDIPNLVHNMDDSSLSSEIFEKLLSTRQENELQQFHASKAFTGYIDRLVKNSYDQAESMFDSIPKCK